MNFTKYNNTYPYPTKSDFTSTYYYKEGKLVATSTVKMLEHHIPEIPLNSCIKEVIFDTEAYYVERRKYVENTKLLREQFKADLADELGLTNHPKYDKLYSLAEEFGDGFQEIYDYAEKLSELLD